MDAHKPNNSAPEENLEQFIAAELQRLPDREAPVDLGDRVMSALRHPAPVTWWRSVRGRVLAITCVSICLPLLAGTVLMSSLWVPVAAAWMESARAWGQVLLNEASLLLSVLSAAPNDVWFWGVGLFSAMVFVMMVGLGSLLARIILARHSPPQMG